MTEGFLRYRTPSPQQHAQLRELLLAMWEASASGRAHLAPDADPAPITFFLAGLQLQAAHIPIDVADKARYLAAARGVAADMQPPPTAIALLTAAYLLDAEGNRTAEVVLLRLETVDGYGGELMVRVTRSPGQPPSFGRPRVRVMDETCSDQGMLVGFFAAVATAQQRPS